jgi:hypothetical protein
MVSSALADSCPVADLCDLEFLVLFEAIEDLKRPDHGLDQLLALFVPDWHEINPQYFTYIMI